VINGILTDNQGASPYLTNQVTLAGIGTDKILANKSYALQYINFLTLNNTGTAIQSIVVNNITQGSQYTLLADIPQSIQFTQAGENILKFTVNAGGSSYTSYQKVNVEGDGNGPFYRPMGTMGANCTPTNQLLESTIPFQGYGETQATNSFADYHIYYHTLTPGGDCEKVLRKPIIILDGFDPGDDRDYGKLYRDYLVNKDNNTSLGNQLRDKGYDVIILNFPKLGETINGEPGEQDLSIPSSVKVNGTPQTINAFDRDGGADYIERNAFLLVKLIQQVNQTLTNNSSTEKIVVVGPSMGGLISRYALAYMEKKQAEGAPDMDHNCRLWVSFDSPHEGANIPLAIQENLDFFGTVGANMSASEAYETQLRSPAARQMLIEQRDGTNSSSLFHTTFYTNLKANGLANSNGYPVNLRKVTLLNGTGNGTGTYTPGTLILDGEGLKGFFGIKVFMLKDNFLPAYNQNIRIVSERIAYKSKGLPIITFEWYFTNKNIHGSMDAVPGSTFNSTEVLYKQLHDGLNQTKNLQQRWFAIKYLHSFIPSISALGFKNTSFDWNSRVDNRNLVCNNEIYFDNYYIPSTNQEHIYLNTDNIQWLNEEIDKGQPGCAPVCSYDILGPSNPLCINSIHTFTLNQPLPSGVTTNWLLSSNLQKISSTNNSITVKSISKGTGLITAKIENPCGAGSIVVKSDIIIGQPKPGLLSWTWDLPPKRVTLSVDEVPEATSYQWYLNGVLKATTSVPYYALLMKGNVSCGNSYYFGVRAVGVCGTSDESYVYAEMPSCSFGYKVSPNPAANNISIGLLNETENSEMQKAPGILKIEIYDKMGALKLSRNFSSLQSATNISVASISSDVYTLRIFDGKVWQSCKILIQH